jgi:haloacetate dehalogenase
MCEEAVAINQHRLSCIALLSIRTRFKMFEGFKEFNVSVQKDVTIHCIKSGAGPPLLLLHGFPQTHHIWHKVAPHLIKTFTVIAIDLRGYGQSSKPASSAEENHKPYAKSVMALDCISVMSSLGFSKFNILSHDRGARVAHKLCVDHPEKVEKLMLLDICPTLAMFEKTNKGFATAYWHWFFLIQPAPFPEALILKNTELFQEKFFGGRYAGNGGLVFDDQAMKEYVKQYTDEETVHSMCEDYRAAATIDLVEARKDREAERKIQCPVRVIWGKNGIIQSSFDALGEWREVSSGEVTGEAVESGHYIAEENPEVLLKHVDQFFGSEVKL